MDSPPAFDDVYERHVGFVIRSVAALGVPAAQVDDAAQEVFLVVYRKLATYEDRAALKTWIYGIAVRVARTFRRTIRRKHVGTSDDVFPLAEVLPAARGTAEEIAQADDLRRLSRLLGALDEEKREVLVLAELEELSAPEIAEALELNLNTVYGRLRAARKAFDEAILREQARERRS